MHTVLVRQAVQPEMLSDGPILLKFDVYRIRESNNAAIASQLIATWLLSVLHLMDWNVLVSWFGHLVGEFFTHFLFIVLSVLDGLRRTDREFDWMYSQSGSVFECVKVTTPL